MPFIREDRTVDGVGTRVRMGTNMQEIGLLSLPLERERPRPFLFFFTFTLLCKKSAGFGWTRWVKVPTGLMSTVQQTLIKICQQINSYFDLKL